MHPLYNYIGIRGFGPAPASGRYINELPGISMKVMQKIANEEQVTFMGVWSDVQARAWTRLSTDLRNRLRAKYKIKLNRGLFKVASSDDGEQIPVSEHYRGFVIDSGIDLNSFFAYCVNTVVVPLEAEQASLTIKFFDRLGQELDSFTKTNAAAGPNVFNVAKTYATPFLFVAVDASNTVLKETTFIQEYLDGCYMAFADVCGQSCTPVIYGAETMKETPFAIGKTSTSYGLMADIMAVCDYSSLINYQKENFLSAWLHVLGAELMLERMYSQKKNEFTTVDAETAEELRDHYTGEYENALEDIVAGLYIPEEDSCLECREFVSHRERLP